MIPFEKTYDIKELARHNLHIHSTNSTCANKEMTLPAIIKTAEDCGLKTIAIVNHSHPGRNAVSIPEGNAALRKELMTIKTNVRVLIGGELSCYGVGKYTETDEVNSTLDFKLYAQNHYHTDGDWEHPADRSPAGYVEHMISCLEELFASGRADCIAHPLSAHYLDHIDPSEFAAAFTDNKLGYILQKAKDAGCAMEINVKTFCGNPELSRRFFNIGREIGTAFTFGTDAHLLKNIDTSQFVDAVMKIIK